MRLRHRFYLALSFVLITLSAARAEAPWHAATSDRPAQLLRVKPGDTMMRLLTRSGVATGDAQEAISALAEVWDPRDLQIGQEVALKFGVERLQALALEAGLEQNVIVARTGDGHFTSSAQPRHLARVPQVALGVIGNSLYEAAVAAGVPMPVLTEMIRAFSYDVDFQREVQPGDSFEVLYERIIDRSGKTVGTGDVIYAAMTLSGQTLRLYRYIAAGQTEPDFYNARGESVRKALLRTPIDGARLTSRFGLRHHPILGYTAMHKGVDFGAPAGTPIYAAGDGQVVKAGLNGGYGNYVLLRHAGIYATAYAHMSRVAVHAGQHVRQGQVIGFVGMTGLATGPHLHYEVHVQDQPINPLSVKVATGRRLDGRELAAFRAVADETDRQLLSLRQDNQIASAAGHSAD